MVSEMIHPRKQRFDVVEKLNTIIERFQKGYPDFKFVFTFNTENVFIINDSVKFLQVVNNLLSNAIKWSPSGSRIDINVDNQTQKVTIEVKDPGIGIPEEFRSVLFQRNTPASRPGLRGEKSIGMGLYIVKKLVNLMGGKLSFQSEENEGTTFRLQFPGEDVKPDP
jgi:two-component system, OmpR family, sensor histidine kinase VicK